MRNIKRVGFLILLNLLLVSVLQAQKIEVSDEIRLNQVGFYPHGPKTAIIEGPYDGPFHITPVRGQDSLYSGYIRPAPRKGYGDRPVRVADFSAFSESGSYRLYVPELGYSHTFRIQHAVHREAAKAALKGYYFQRVSTDLPEAFAGKWHRKAGHPDDSVLVHPSAASPDRPAGTVISSSRGWYDAGDYNKYIVNSGITMGTLMSFYEDYPDYARLMRLNIPEKDNDIPDLLDEVLWNLRWMLTMQDPADGGVYHKMTSAGFSGMIMPERDKATRYVVQKSTAAALNFAAVMAQAARVYAEYSSQLPGLADSCLTAARKAWQWAGENPDVVYNQSVLNRQFDPDITTGAYGDHTLQDEFIWAASELCATTGDEGYFQAVELFSEEVFELPSWSQVRALGLYTLLRFEEDLSDAAKADISMIRRMLLNYADELVNQGSKSAYMTAMGSEPGHFIWGSSSVSANQGIALLQAYRQKPKLEYIDYALANLDYLLGRNGTGYSFLTGYGDRTPMFPHHRPSETDDVDEPVPGLLAGGPNSGRQDGCDYPSNLPDQSYVDAECSYASNEIAINWNAPFVYLAGALEALQHEAGYSDGVMTEEGTE